MAKVTNATSVSAMLVPAGHGLHGVRLTRNDGANGELSTHGAYASRADARSAADFMIDRLGKIITARGSCTAEDVDRVHRQAQSWLNGPRSLSD